MIKTGGKPTSAGCAMTLSAVEPRSSEVSSGTLEWLTDRARHDALSVERVPLEALTDWSFETHTGNLRHRSGHFFSVEGVSVRTNFGLTPEWMQPVIDQSEVGILGFLVGYHEGVLRFLVQRKIEPGNINVSQLSPTVQATRSNYMRIHGGISPPYVDYFIDPSRHTVLVDQLQTEQAARYSRKENRNMVVEVDPDDVPLWPDYRWVTLRELLAFAACRNVLNFDTRSVLSCLPFSPVGPATPVPDDAPFPVRVLSSLTAEVRDDRADAIKSWLARLQRRFSMTVDRIPLRRVAGWKCNGEVIYHDGGRFFEVLGVAVEASTREVQQWNQPLVRSLGRGVIGFLCQSHDGILRFLVRGLMEPGEPRVRMGPTLQCVPDNHDVAPPFFGEIVRASECRVRFRTVQSEEGGRFYHDERLLVVVECDPDEPIDCPLNYMWMTLSEIKEMIARYRNVNAEARSLLACLPLGI